MCVRRENLLSYFQWISTARFHVSYTSGKNLFDKIAKKVQAKGVKVKVFNLIPSFSDRVYLHQKQ